MNTKNASERITAERCAKNIATRIGMIFSSGAITATVEEIGEYVAAMRPVHSDVIGYAIARLEDDEIDQALNALKVARGDFVKDHYPDDNSRMAVSQLRDAVNGMAAPIDYADALLRYIEQLERDAFRPETAIGGI